MTPRTPNRTTPVLLTDELIRDATVQLAGGEHAEVRAVLNELWRAVVREMAWAHYEELFARDPHAGDIAWDAFSRELTTAAADEHAWMTLATHIRDPADRFTEPALTPVSLPVMTSTEHLAVWMQERLSSGVRRANDPRHSTDAAAQRALVRTVESIVGVLMRDEATLGTVRMVAEVRPDYDTEWAAMKAVASKLGIGTTEALRKWVPGRTRSMPAVGPAPRPRSRPS
jgi:hypothetical protein